MISNTIPFYHACYYIRFVFHLDVHSRSHTILHQRMSRWKTEKDSSGILFDTWNTIHPLHRHGQYWRSGGRVAPCLIFDGKRFPSLPSGNKINKYAKILFFFPCLFFHKLNLSNGLISAEGCTNIDNFYILGFCISSFAPHSKFYQKVWSSERNVDVWVWKI